MSEDVISVEEFVAYLDSIAPLYPTGVPRSLIEAELSSESPQSAKNVLQVWGNPDSKLWFIVSHKNWGENPFAGSEGELLKAAVEKGMQLKLEELYFINAHSLTGEVEEYITRHSPELILVLGSRLCPYLGGEDSEFESIRGEWKFYNGQQRMITYDALSVLDSIDTKRAFWIDLKKVVGALGK